MLVLEIGGGFKMDDGDNIHMGRAEFLLEFLAKFFPINKSVRLQIFLLPMEYSGSPFLCSSCFHVGQSPNDFSLVIREVVQAQTDVGLAGTTEGGAAGMNSEGRAGGGPRVGGPGCRESEQGLGVIIGFSDFKEVICVIRVSSFCWVFTSRVCNLERACSRDARCSFSMASKGAVSRNCFLKLSKEESSAGKYTECNELVLGVLGAQNMTMVNLTGSDWSSGEIPF
jgi:hypothetical protein